MKNKVWYQEEVNEVVEHLATDQRHGLTIKEAKRRLDRFGPNTIEKKAAISPVGVFLAQFKDFMVLVLIGATLISGLLGEYVDAITILAIIVINAVLGFVQEYRAEHSLEAIRRLSAPQARVIRGGETMTIEAQNLVPGDLVLLEAGDVVPADGRLVEASALEVEESALTGESLPVKKRTEAIQGDEVPLGDRVNQVFMGTVITRGRAKEVITATGMATEMGQIAGMLEKTSQEETPLKRRLNQLGQWIVWACLAICAVVVVMGVLRGEPLYQMFLAGVSLAVAAIPEGLPAIVTVCLALGVQRMVKRRAIVKKLPAVETLGCATVICSDKTGTLTQNEMTVRRLYLDGERVEVTGQGYEPHGEFLASGGQPALSASLKLMFKAAALCNNARLHRQNLPISGSFRGNHHQHAWSITGDPTEGALLVMAAKGGIWRDSVERDETRLEEIPFESERKRMSVIYEAQGRYIAYTKGAPDVVLGLCGSYLEEGEVKPLTPQIREQLLEENKLMARDALRVLALAYRELPKATGDPQIVEADLIFLGLAGMQDPPRPEAIRAVSECQRAGIMPVMITGDHQETALAVAREMGIAGAASGVLTGEKLENLSDEQLEEMAEDIAVYARVSPRHKLRIVKALKARGHVVAMTGDGVNDAPAVKEADIGVAMGVSGTDVTREAAAMILADDNFATIVAAIEEGRGIYDNIRKFIRYLLSCNIGEILTMFVAALVGLPLPLVPIQILWVNLVTDGLPAMALGVDSADPEIMLRSPRKPDESVFSQGLGGKILGRGLEIGFDTLLVFVISLWLGSGNVELARTMAFAALVMLQLFNVFDCRSELHSVFEVGVFTNKFLVFSVALSLLLELAVIYTPALQPVFQTVPLNGLNWALILLISGWRTALSALIHYVWRPLSQHLVYLRA